MALKVTKKTLATSATPHIPVATSGTATARSTVTPQSERMPRNVLSVAPQPSRAQGRPSTVAGAASSTRDQTPRPDQAMGRLVNQLVRNASAETSQDVRQKRFGDTPNQNDVLLALEARYNNLAARATSALALKTYGKPGVQQVNTINQALDRKFLTPSDHVPTDADMHKLTQYRTQLLGYMSDAHADPKLKPGIQKILDSSYELARHALGNDPMKARAGSDMLLGQLRPKGNWSNSFNQVSTELALTRGSVPMEYVGRQLSENKLTPGVLDLAPGLAGLATPLALGAINGIRAARSTGDSPRFSRGTDNQRAPYQPGTNSEGRAQAVTRDDQGRPRVTPLSRGETKVAGNRPEDFRRYKTDADVPEIYRQDERFPDLAYDDSRRAVHAGSRQEAMAGLEAEARGLIKYPISRGPKEIEFYDARGVPYDVKTPPSDPRGVREFDADQAGKAIAKQVRTNGENSRTGKEEPVRVILDVTYLTSKDYSSLQSWIKNNLTAEERKLIVTVDTRTK